MDKPLRITFRDMQSSKALEAEVRARAAGLETFYPAIVGCRVLLDIPHRHRSRGRHVHVRIELSLPGEDLVVDHEPTLHGSLKDVEEVGHRKEDDVEAVHRSALVAVHEAFDVARRQLQDRARRERGDVKTHHVPGSDSRSGAG